MELSNFHNILHHPETISDTQTNTLSTLVEQYPYFQALRALYLKGLKQKGSYKYNNALKVTAAYTTDRSILFDYITSELFIQNNISLEIKKNSKEIKNISLVNVDDISQDNLVKIDDQLRQQLEETQGVLDPNLFSPKSKLSPETPSTLSKNETLTEDLSKAPEEKLNLGSPLEFSASEKHSFSEWLKLTSCKPIDRTPSKDNRISVKAKTSPLVEKLTIIDKFISENPKIRPIDNKQPKPNLVNNDDAESQHLMTETLARIYLEQKNYDKAIQSYRILSLKYPEKNTFFASQIKSIEELKAKNI